MQRKGVGYNAMCQQYIMFSYKVGQANHSVKHQHG